MKNGMKDIGYPDHGVDLGLGCNMRVVYDTDAAEFEAVVEGMLTSGDYTLLQKNAIGDNRYVTLKSGEGMVHLYYMDGPHTTRVIYDTLEHSVLPMYESEGYEKVTDTTLCVMALDYTHREILDGNGMSYVITLADGRFVVIDGGYRQDACRLYQFLCDHNCRKDGKIVIAAWFMSHAHGDHFGALNEFAKVYGDRVTVEHFVCNPTRPSMFRTPAQANTYFVDQLPAHLAQFGEVKRFRPHAGQVIRFCDAEFEFLYTHEDFFPTKLPYMNDSSTVFRVKVAGTTVLFMGDCEASSSKVISDLYRSDLKCDVMQLNHHCYSGGTIELYEHAAPAWSMWCTSQPAFEMRITGEKYQWIGDAVKSNKYMVDTIGKDHCLIADGPCKILHFPLRDEKDISYYEFPVKESY